MITTIINIVAFAALVLFGSCRAANLARLAGGAEVNEPLGIDIILAVSATVFYATL